MKYQMIKFCEECIEDMLNGDIEFTIPTCVCEVPIADCDSLDKKNVLISTIRVKDRAMVELKD